ncbi:hypothetical protein BD769DRAFT_1638713 [Suillus cothurnatus]|nr:hypothetical protein BD769DRAFT_1638713 [Suillus cothurnatus]
MTPPYLITLNKIPGIDRHELEKLARKEGSGITDEALTFKKPFQTVVRPRTTNHNIHDDYIKHPPEKAWIWQERGLILTLTNGDRSGTGLKQADGVLCKFSLHQ